MRRKSYLLVDIHAKPSPLRNLSEGDIAVRGKSDEPSILNI